MAEGMLRVAQLNAGSLLEPGWDERREVIVAWLEHLAPDIVCLQEIWEDASGQNTAGWLVDQATTADAIDTYFECGADVLVPRHDMVDGEFLRETEREEVVLLPWTVNDPGSMRWLFRAPMVLGIITDRVAEAVRVRSEIASG